MTDNKRYIALYTWTRSQSLFTQAEKRFHTHTAWATHSKYTSMRCARAHVKVQWRRWQRKEESTQYSRFSVIRCAVDPTPRIIFSANIFDVFKSMNDVRSNSTLETHLCEKQYPLVTIFFNHHFVWLMWINEKKTRNCSQNFVQFALSETEFRKAIVSRIHSVQIKSSDGAFHLQNYSIKTITLIE